jgi:uncharacterized protein DUF4157
MNRQRVERKKRVAAEPQPVEAFEPAAGGASRAAEGRSSRTTGNRAPEGGEHAPHAAPEAAALHRFEDLHVLVPPSPAAPSMGGSGGLPGSPGGGAPLQPELRQRFGAALGADLSGVRVHTDAGADRLARSLSARAVTAGPHVFFREGAHAPGTEGGLRLLAHEVTHTVQQASGPVAGAPGPGGLRVSEPHDPSEQAAQRAASRLTAPAAASGPQPAAIPGVIVSAAPPALAPGAVVQRAPDPPPAAAPAAPAAAPAAPAAPQNVGGIMFDMSELPVLRMRAEILESFRPSVLASGLWVGRVFGEKVDLSEAEMQAARKRIQEGFTKNLGAITKRADVALEGANAYYERVAKEGTWDTLKRDLAHYDFLSGTVRKPKDPRPEIAQMGDQIDDFISQLHAALKDGRYRRAADHLESAEKESKRAARLEYRLRMEDIKIAENTIEQLEAIKTASDITLMVLGAYAAGAGLARVAGAISGGAGLAGQALLIGAKVAEGDKIDWKKEGVTGLINVACAVFGGRLQNRLVADVVGKPVAMGVPREMLNHIAASLIVHTGSVAIQTSVEHAYKYDFEAGNKEAAWGQFLTALERRLLDPQSIAMALFSGAIQATATISTRKPGEAPPVDPNNPVMAQTRTTLSKGGTESIGLARSVIEQQGDFYTVRVLATERGGLGTTAQGPLEQARQQMIAAAVARVREGNPGVPVNQTGGGFDKPVEITIGGPPAGGGGAPAGGGGAGGGPPSSPPPSSQPPSSQPPSGPSGTATVPAPAPVPGTPGAGTVPAPPPGGQGPSQMAGTVPAPAPSPSAASAPAPSPSAQSAPAPSPSAASAPAPAPAGMSSTGSNQEQAGKAYEQACQYLDAPVRPGNPIAFAARLDVKIAQYLGFAFYDPKNYKGPFRTLDESAWVVEKPIGGDATNQGLSSKELLRNTQTNEKYLFKPSEGEAATMHQMQGVTQGSYFTRAAAASEIAQKMPSVGKDMPVVIIVQYKGRLGSLQPWVEGTTGLNDIFRTNPKLFQQIIATPEYKKWRANLDAYDYVMNNLDRNLGNIMVKLGPGDKVERFFAIDQDITLATGPRMADPASMKSTNIPAKISRTTYGELIRMKENEASIRAGLQATITEAQIQGMFLRLKTMLGAYEKRMLKEGPDSIFAD